MFLFREFNNLHFTKSLKVHKNPEYETCITLEDRSPSLLPAQPWTSMSAELLPFLTKRNYKIQRFAINKYLHEYVFTVLAYKANFKMVFFVSGHTIGKSRDV
jgi:hypothetical protein